MTTRNTSLHFPLSPSSYSHTSLFHSSIPSQTSLACHLSPCCLATMAGFHRRTATVLILVTLLIAATLGARCVDGSRSMQQARGYDDVRPAPAMRLFGYLPRSKVIPPSGPSEGHNSVGPEKEELMRKP